jgi:5-methylcytosine-specific restriction endonuclease McrA
MSHDFCLIVAAVVVALLATRRGQGAHLDPKRIFSLSERTSGFLRAGNQCEHFNIFGRRCTNAPTHGDHHFPHSKGGATSMSNFVALCARHNLTKGSKIPSVFATRRLERRRRGYFPPGTPVEIIGRQPSRR